MAAGGAVLTMPVFIAGCGVGRTRVATEPVPENPFLEWFGIDEAMVQRVMSELVANGADAADLYFQHRRSNLISMDHGIVSHASSDVSQGVGLRVVFDGKVAYAATEDLTLPAMLGAARTAARRATRGPATAPASFATSRSGDLYVTEVPWAEVGVDRKLPLLNRLDLACRDLDPSVSNVAVSWTDVDERVAIATLDGRLVVDHRPMTRLSAEVTATRGSESQTGFASIAAREEWAWYSGDRIDELAREAVDRTLVLFDARRPPTGEMPVILASGGCGVLLHEAIGHGLEADFNRKGKSSYSGMIGEQVAEPIVTVVDQATMPNKRGALNYDDEGAACGRTTLIDQGILRSYLHDSISSAAYNVATTASGRRQSFRFAPMPRMTCTFLENGVHEKEELIAAVERGVIVDTITDGQVQIGAGDYTFVARNGWLIEKGKTTAPVRDVILTGSGPETLRRISLVANDFRFDSGGWTCGKNGQSVPVSQGMPSVLISSMYVSAASH